MAKKEVDIQPLIEGFREKFGQYCIYGPDGVKYKIGKKNKSGWVRFDFDIEGEFGVSLEVCVTDFLANPEIYMHNAEKNMQKIILDAFKLRQEKSVININTGGMMPGLSGAA